MSATYGLKVREQSARILWGDADLLDQCADTIHGEYMNAEMAAEFLRDLARRYRQAASDATRGRDEVSHA